MKVVIVGYSGSGKSTAARIIGQKHNIPVLHLDTVYWMENWQVRPAQESKAIVAAFMADNADWVTDGNYKALHQTERFRQADKILFFNFNRFTCFFRALGRYMQYKGKTRPDMAAGCREKFDFEFIKWILKDGRTPQKKKAYMAMCEKYADKVVVITSQRQLDNFLEKI